ncbi:UNVERIFIED_CONTAM: hypothetical protein K2H54_037145 [Gekko kuhli]
MRNGMAECSQHMWPALLTASLKKPQHTHNLDIRVNGNADLSHTRQPSVYCRTADELGLPLKLSEAVVGP